ncbi:uncharacterized protein NEFER03_1484 [Nematocida sp. LUAm3]|nr:uncharacterized protein NEFER03_1484 [Nematocida sp. LUAm3]KAI5174476.1 uncharacterized protein NEFER02_0597 [Nematocida sp. LUAm2]KAI5177954.1 uncharacterized protein NEFER01_1136 [Nematocida sp. LUAm1]
MREVPEGVIVECEVKANAKNQSIYAQNSIIYISVSSAPVENKANKEILETISKSLKIKKSSLSIISGGKSKDKSILIKDVSLEQAKAAIKFLEINQ